MKIMDDKVVIVTGGGKGIGFGISTAFAKEGASLVITGRTESTLKNAKENLEKNYGIKVLALTADGSKMEDVKNVIDKTIEEFGKIDTIVNNAQASKSGVPLADHTIEDFNLAIYSGLYGTFNYMNLAFPYLKETKGSVINFASGAGLAGRPGQSSYAAAKEGIRGLSRVAATEWGEFGINVNVICPLAMTESLVKWKEEYPELYARTIQGIPMGRFADPEKDIGRLCIFLASEDGKYITGETITVQGGSGLRP
ncbi:SDR family NAD(P)-dependent oxidoreductase [Clostridium sp. Cult2]|uniref:SDR family NAD(P)-dependent oxidoreductase n=1 Tax=Clostridium sp. Cult2 TaxID=2079003 RepID=UPI001F288392|nr:SDR family oxidoreductase [Clostridium sp. Cult2]MCF6464747.1 short-chain dehydrogenase [Clostridium sp. Cult2]